MRRLIAAGIVFGLATGALGCRFIKRDAKRYRADTTALLDTKAGALTECYNGVLKSESSATGSVVITFKLKEETGVIYDVAVAEDKSTAPKAVQDCVVQSLDGLALDPPDAVVGHATYTYEFEVAGAAPQPTSSDFKVDEDKGAG